MRFGRLLSFLLPTICVAQYDILISNARIADGTGAPWFSGSLAIRGDSIAAIGHLPSGATGRIIIDAKGQIVAPGFIDIHSHSRGAIFQVPSAENVIRQGVTTVLDGNDGNSPLPIKPFLDKLNNLPIGVNFGLFVGQGSIREQVMGLVNRPATTAELDKMRDVMKQAMLDGAFGLSTGLFYVPGNFTPPDEVVEIAKVAGEYGGMHISHIREEASQILDSVRETIRIGELGRLPTQVSHHKIIGGSNWGLSRETLRLVDEARARGVDVTIDQYPYTASSTGTAALFPQWSLEGGRSAFLERLAAPEQRAKIKAIIVQRIKDDRGGGDPKNVVMANCSFDHSLDGKNLAQLAKAPTLEAAADAAIDIQTRGGCSAVYHAIGEEDVERIMRAPYAMIASDGGVTVLNAGVPHPRNYGTFPRVLGRYTRERHILSLEEAIRKMTSLPAGRLKLFDRGLLRPGMKADIVIFDPATIGDRATFEKPHQYAEGVSTVVVNGKAVLLNGQMTGERSGRVIYGPQMNTDQRR